MASGGIVPVKMEADSNFSREEEVVDSDFT